MTGSILLAINPFTDVLISRSDVIKVYKEKILNSLHVCGIVDDAIYNDMMRSALKVIL